MRLLTLEEYNALSPYAQGYACYMQAAHEGSPIPDKCPYQKGTLEHAEFARGDWDAMQACQEVES